MKELILGPPGTGKTTELLNIVKKHLDEAVDPRDIGYFSFTKKAAIEAKSRAIEKFPMYTEEDFPYFRTLHSLAFNQLHLKKTQVMQKANYKEFQIGYKYQQSSILFNIATQLLKYPKLA